MQQIHLYPPHHIRGFLVKQSSEVVVQHQYVIQAMYDKSAPQLVVQLNHGLVQLLSQQALHHHLICVLHEHQVLLHEVDHGHGHVMEQDEDLM